MEHVFKDREDGLAWCEVCRCGECELATDCPGRPIIDFARVNICRGDADFRDGKWYWNDKEVPDFKPWKDELRLEQAIDALIATLRKA